MLERSTPDTEPEAAGFVPAKWRVRIAWLIYGVSVIALLGHSH
jgi:hypothetical protein